MQPQVENHDAALDVDPGIESVDNDDIRPVSDVEKRLRKEVARFREHARIAQNERDAACAAAVRDRDSAIAAAQDEARGRVLRAELRSAATRAGILDLDALRLADTSTVTSDENGELQGVDDVVAALRQQKPYLFGPDNAVAPAVTTTQLQKPPAPAQPSMVDARSLSKEAWRIERDRLLSSSR